MVQVFKFIAVGISNTCLSFAVFSMLVRILPPSPVMAAISQMASYLCGIVASYLLNRFWVFRVQRTPHRTLPKFIAVQTGLMVLSSAMIAIASAGLPVRIELIWVAVMTLITVLNFTFLKKWVFKRS